MQPAIDNATRMPHRAGFTIIELMVVILIISALVAISVAVFGDAVEQARIDGTKATIKQLDSMTQDRIEGLGRVNLRSQAQQLKFLYDTASPVNSPAQMPLEIAEIIVRKDRYRAAFPQRLEDLWGLDSVADTGDDAPLWAVWKNQTGATAGSPRPPTHTAESESSELLYLSLTEGTVFGSPSLGIDRINLEHIQDTDNDGVPEFVDAWGRPLRFYNWPTRLIRPVGETSSPPGTPVTFGGINAAVFGATAVPLMPDVPKTTGNLAYDDYFHSLNQDPDDQTGALTAAQNSTGIARDVFQLGTLANAAEPVTETFYGTLDTYHVPLIVSGGPDEDVGLFEPDGSDPRTPSVSATFADFPRRLALPLDATDPALLDLLYDNITNRTR